MIATVKSVDEIRVHGLVDFFALKRIGLAIAT
jgi:hypothetical protein